MRRIIEGRYVVVVGKQHWQNSPTLLRRVPARSFGNRTAAPRPPLRVQACGASSKVDTWSWSRNNIGRTLLHFFDGFRLVVSGIEQPRLVLHCAFKHAAHHRRSIRGRGRETTLAELSYTSSTGSGS